MLKLQPHPQATIQIAKGAIAGDTPSVSGEVANAEIDLNLKTTTTVVIRVTAEDGETMQDYTIAVTRVPEADATLEALTIDGESVAGFAPAIAEYTVEVEGNLAIDLIAKATHDQAEIQIAGTSGVGQVSTRTQLNLRTTTTIAIEVTSEDRESTRAYTITVIRLPSKDASLTNIEIVGAESGQAEAVALLPGGFASTRTDYTAKVEDDLSVTINAEATDPQATVQIYERTSTEDIPKGVSGEVANATIGLNLKTTTTVVIRVIAEDGETTQNYIVAFTRVPEADATLETLTINGEPVAGFDPAIAGYTVEVEGNLAIDLIAKATHDQAMIQIAGTSDVGEVSTRTQLNLRTTTTLVIEVESEDDANTREYTIAVKRLPSEDESLASLRIANASGDIVLTPAFSENRTSYTAEVTGDLDVMINAGATHPQAMVQIAKETIAVDTRSFRGETASAAIDLNLGTVRTVTNVVVRVIAEDGTSQDYTVEITRLPSVDESLASLEIASGSSIALTPSFAADETRYTAEVADDLSVTISAGATHPQASVQIAKGAIAEDTPSFRGETASASIVLNLRIVTTVVIRVTAEDGITVQDYIVEITRLPSKDASLASLEIAGAESGQAVALLPGGFASTRTDYTAKVADDLSVTISAGPTTHPQATVQIAKETIAEDTRSFRGETASAAIDLNLEAGAVTTVVIRVTAEDGTTTQDYTILITRVPEADTTLKTLTIGGVLVTDFDPATARYTAEVTGDQNVMVSAEAAHPQASIQIAGTSGVGQVSTRTQLNLAITTTIAIEVTSENGRNTRRYTIVVTRLPSMNVSLASLEIASASGSIALDPGFAADETGYTAEVADDLSVTISAEATHPQASVQIGNTPRGVSGEAANAAIDLNLKTTTTVIIRVTAEDNTAQDYTILITRVPEADATLEVLTIGGDLVTDFDPAIAGYTVKVKGNLTIDLSAKATHDEAMIQIGERTPSTGQADATINLNLATTTTIVIQVTSEDDENTRTYTIAIVRLPSSDAGLMNLEIASEGTNENIPLLPSGFSSTKTDYTAEARGASQISVTATATHPQANIQVAIAEIMKATPILQSGESAVLGLNQETTTTLVIRVTAEDGTPSEDLYIVEISYVVGHIRIRTKIFLEGPLR